MSDKRDNLIRYGKLTTAMDANRQKIENLATPTSDADAATKKYVDDAAQGSLVDYSQVQNKPQINGTTLQGGNNTLYGSSLAVSATDATKVDAALAGKRGLADFGVGGLPNSASCYCTLSIDGSEPVASTYNSATRWGGVILEGHSWDVFLSNGAYTLAESIYLTPPVSITFDSTYAATLTSGGHTYVVKAYADTLALSSSVPIVGTSLTFATTTAVTGGTIWSHIWGALTAIPDAATSLYGWLTAKLAGYLPLSGGTMTGELKIFTDKPDGDPRILAGFDEEACSYLARNGIGLIDSQNQYYQVIQTKNGILALTNDLAVTPWSASTSYSLGNIVAYNGATYRCILATTAGTLPTNTAYWTADAVAVNSQIPTDNSQLANGRGYITLPATRYAIVALSSTSLTNAACNTDIAAEITTAKTYTLPAPVFDASNNRQVRDLYLYANVGTGGSVTFANTDASGNSLTFVSDDFSALAAEDGLNAWLLSEVAANTFLVKRLALTTGTL